MNQSELYRQVARRTGENLHTIHRIGFSIEEPSVQTMDPEPDDLPPNVVDWDQLAKSRN